MRRTPAASRRERRLHHQPGLRATQRKRQQISRPPSQAADDEEIAARRPLFGVARPHVESDSDSDDSAEMLPRTPVRASRDPSPRVTAPAPSGSAPLVYVNDEQKALLQEREHMVTDLSDALRVATEAVRSEAYASTRDLSRAETRGRQSAAAAVVLAAQARESCVAADLALLLLAASDASFPRALGRADVALQRDAGGDFMQQPAVLAHMLLFAIVHRLMMDSCPTVAAQEKNYSRPAMTVAARETQQELHKLLRQHAQLQESHDGLIHQAAEHEWASEELREGVEEMIDENGALRGEMTESAAALKAKLDDAQEKLRKSRQRTLHGRNVGGVALGDVEGWASLRTQLQLARGEAESAEEDVEALRVQVEQLTQDRSDR